MNGSRRGREEPEDSPEVDGEKAYGSGLSTLDLDAEADPEKEREDGDEPSVGEQVDEDQRESVEAFERLVPVRITERLVCRHIHGEHAEDGEAADNVEELDALF